MQQPIKNTRDTFTSKKQHLSTLKTKKNQIITIGQEFKGMGQNNVRSQGGSKMKKETKKGFAQEK